jgi:hypothetical protein
MMQATRLQEQGKLYKAQHKVCRLQMGTDTGSINWYSLCGRSKSKSQVKKDIIMGEDSNTESTGKSAKSYGVSQEGSMEATAPKESWC